VVLAIAGDVGDDAEIVRGKGGIVEFFETSATADEHVVEPRGEGDRDETVHRRGVDRFGVGSLPRLLVAHKTMNAGGVPRMETNEAGSDQVAVLTDVEAGDEVVVTDVAFGWGVPAFGDLSQVFFEVGDDVLEPGNLGGVLGGAGLYGEGETVDELPKLLGRDIGVSIEGGEH